MDFDPFWGMKCFIHTFFTYDSISIAKPAKSREVFWDREISGLDFKFWNSTKINRLLFFLSTIN